MSLRKHEQSNSYLKPTEEENSRLTIGSSAVDTHLISGATSAYRSWLLTSVTTPICLCKLFLCKACAQTCTHYCVLVYLMPHYFVFISWRYCNVSHCSGCTCYLSNAKLDHTTGASRRCAWRSNEAGSGRTGCQQNYSLRK